MFKCRKFQLTTDSCSLIDCDYRKSCTEKPEFVSAPTENINVTETNKEVFSKPEVVSEPKPVESELVSEHENKFVETVSEIVKDVKELKIENNESELKKQIHVRQFNAKLVPDGINVSFNDDINLIMTKKKAIALSNTLQKIIMEQKNMTNSVSLREYIGEEKFKEILPSEEVNKSKRLYKFDISPVPNDDEILSVVLTFGDKTQIEFIISKRLAMTLGATTLNKAK